MAIAILDPDIVAEDRKSGDAAEMFQLRIVQDTDDHSQMQYQGSSCRTGATTLYYPSGLGGKLFRRFDATAISFIRGVSWCNRGVSF